VIEQQGYYAIGDGGWAQYDWSATSLAAANGVTIILPAGQSAGTPGRYTLRIPATGIHPEAAGASCNTPVGGTGSDDTASFNNLTSYISNSYAGVGEIIQSTGKTTTCLINSGNLQVRPGVRLVGVGNRFARRDGVKPRSPTLGSRTPPARPIAPRSPEAISLSPTRARL
jgi:hypothetical protein